MKSKKKFSPINGVVRGAADHKRVLKANDLAQEGDLDEALSLLDDILKKNPDDVPVLVFVGQILKEKKQIKQALETLQSALDIEPDNIDALLELGQTCLRGGFKEKALNLLDSAIRKAPDNASVNIGYAAALHRFGHLSDAMFYNRRALSLQAGKPAKDKGIKLRDDFNKPETERLMWKTLSQLHDAGIHAFACYGSLLGPVREGGLLPFDKDLDFALPYSEMKRADRVMKQNGWVVANHATAFFNPVAYYHEDPEASVDLFGMMVEEKTGITVSGFWMPGVPKEWNQFTEYDPIELRRERSPEGDVIWSLKDPERMLETIYGPEWKVPDGYFDTVIAARNLRGFSLVTQCFAFPRIYSNIEKGNIKKAAALLAAALKGMPKDELLHEVKENLMKFDEARAFLA